MSGTKTDFPKSTIPIPDPTEITTREIAKLRDELTSAFDAAIANVAEISAAKRDILAATLAGARERADAFRESALVATDNAAERNHERIEALAKLTDERIEGLKIAFREDKIAAATAVAAAFAAQEKLNIAQNLSNSAAITKSELSTTKELESLDEKIDGLKQTFASDIRNLEGRLNRGEGGVVGAHALRDDQRANSGQVLVVVGVVVSVLIGVVNFFLPHAPQVPVPAPSPPQVVYLPAPAAAGAIVAVPKP
jgi:hypothetical protein